MVVLEGGQFLMSEVPPYKQGGDGRWQGWRGSPLVPPSTMYRGTSPMRNDAPLGPQSRIMPIALWWSWGVGLFLVNEVPLSCC